MATGDGIFLHSANNTQLIVQPAVGVTWLITSIALDYVMEVPRLTNGSEESQIAFQIEDTGGSAKDGYLQNFTNCKIFLDNTNYMRIAALGGASKSSAITGIVYSE